MVKTATKLSFKYATSVLNIILGLLGTIVVARYLGAGTIGIVAYCFSLVSLLSLFSDFGVSTAHLKIKNDTIGSDSDSTYFWIKTILLAFSILTVLVFILFYNSDIPNQVSGHDYNIILLLALVTLIFTHYTKALSTIFMSDLEIAKSSLPKLANQIIFFIAKCVVSILGLGAVYLAGTYVISALIGMLLALRFIELSNLSRINYTLAKRYILFAIPVGIIGIFNSAGMDFCNILIGSFSGTEDLGNFTLSRRLTSPAIVAMQAFNGIVFVKLARFSNQQDSLSIISFSNKMERHSSLIVLPMIIFLYLFSNEIISLFFGNSFDEAGPILSILAISVYFRIISAPYSTQVISQGFVKLGLIISFLNFTLLMLLLLYTIPEKFFGVDTLGLGGFGGALSLAIFQFYRYIISRLISKKINDAPISFNIIKHLIAGIIVIFVFDQIIKFFNFEYLYLFAFPFILCSLWFQLYFLSEFSYNDLKLYSSTLNPMNLLAYSKKELS